MGCGDGLGGFAAHHAGAARLNYDFAALIDPAMLEHDHAPLWTRFRFAHFDDFGLGSNRIADKDRSGELGFLKTQVADSGAEGQFADRQPDHEAEREDAVD